MIDYVKITILAVAVSVVFGSGYWAGYSKYVAYKKEVEIAVKAQEAKVESIQKQHELVTKGISDASIMLTGCAHPVPAACPAFPTAPNQLLLSPPTIYLLNVPQQP